MSQLLEIKERIEDLQRRFQPIIDRTKNVVSESELVAIPLTWEEYLQMLGGLRWMDVWMDELNDDIKKEQEAHHA